MQPSLREDILEALYVQLCSGGMAFRIEDLVRVLGRSEADIREILPSLEAEGDLVIGDEGTITLSPSGQADGGKITRKHRILECFFKEMLGMSPGTASEEACTLEHQVSDEAIDRLGTYLSSAQGGLTRNSSDSSPLLPTLMDSAVDSDLVVSCIRCRVPASRLRDLGVIPGERIRVVRKIPGNGIVVKVKGCDIALSREIAGSIYVEKPA